ncbi:uncharacterized protein TM35_000121260 [Trypanosoma theileri]|uniref:Uncharacterized protein n=1 Tax=Trypanosoma theileri TaxID=67003 RepID=A0A1X0NXL8_9TRYP|nr:uncharacterized protein TM35_000121260 [Trypanosoma theileri]ORC89351.1 hypothetical protein TM35_000121260 [Trypanosoma theileri]
MSGYRKRDYDDYAGEEAGRVRYSDLPPETKLQRRRVERREKKERERTLAYFTSVQRALDEWAAGGGDAGNIAALVDGFIVELIKLLRADPTLHLLRNGTVCRAIEAALAHSLLLHLKSLLYVLLGRVYDTAASPTASYVLEAIVARLTAALAAEASNQQDGETLRIGDEGSTLAAEMTVGGPGAHADGGVPSVATLLAGVVDELAERSDDIILHEVAARAVRSIVLLLAGRTIRGAPPLQHPVKFIPQLENLATALMQSLETTFADSRTQSDVDVWLAIASTPTASFIVQNLLRVSEEGTAVDVVVRQRLESVNDSAICNGKKGSTLLRRLLLDPMGCHIFQAYLKVPVPTNVLEACDLIATRKAAEAEAGKTQKSTKERRLKEIMRDIAAENKMEEKEEEGTNTLNVDEYQTCWDKALDVLLEAMDELLDPSVDRVSQAAYAIQDLVLFTPTALHLERIWEKLLKPRLELFISNPALAQVLVLFTRKCAFSGPPNTSDDEDNIAAVLDNRGAGGSSSSTGSGGEVLPKDIEQHLYADVAQGVRYFPVSTEFQKSVTTTLCFGMKQLCTKGATQYLLVEGGMREKGYEVARCILHFNTSASAMFIHAMDKLCLSDVDALMRQTKGSLVIQQYLRAAAGLHAFSSNSSSTTALATGKNVDEQKDEKTALMRFLRRIKELLPVLVDDKCAAFVVEVLYEVGSLGLKEELVKLLVPIYSTFRRVHVEMKDQEEGQEQQEDVEGNTSGTNRPQMRGFIAGKVMTKCCVELYMHRPEEWMKLARRQCQVQRLLQRMSAVTL